MRIFLVVVMALLLSACAETTHYAPVTEISTIEPLPKKGVYRVLPDDTLYSIAWRYGLDYRYLARINHIIRPYHIESGQIIYLKGKHKSVQAVSSHSKKTRAPRSSLFSKMKEVKKEVRIEKEPTARVSYWNRPACGPVIQPFSSSNKGINIGGQVGDPIFATAPGKVVYSGAGLRAYGNLIIIKHNSVFLSAYAHNSKVLVNEGDWVRAGQKIALMGSTGAQRVMLHFEIRRSGKPINPLSYLAKR